MAAKKARIPRALDRREALTAAGAVVLAGLGNSVVRGASAQSTPALLTPPQTPGPYWVDERLNRSDIRWDPSTQTLQPGFPLYLDLHVVHRANGAITPLPNAVVDVWHCNALGVYSDEAVEHTTGQQYLRGYQVTDAQGRGRFLTIYPGWYSGRTIHIHCRVRLFAGGALTYDYTTQFYFDDAISDMILQHPPYNQRPPRTTDNATDSIYVAADCMTTQAKGRETMLRLAAHAQYAVATFTVTLKLSLPHNSTCE